MGTLPGSNALVRIDGLQSCLSGRFNAPRTARLEKGLSNTPVALEGPRPRTVVNRTPHDPRLVREKEFPIMPVFRHLSCFACVAAFIRYHIMD